MSRRRGEFEHRTSIFEGAFRAWSHLGGLDPHNLDTRSCADLDPFTFVIENDKRLINGKSNKKARTSSITSTGASSVPDKKDDSDNDGEDSGNDNDALKRATGEVGNEGDRKQYPYEPLPRSGLGHPFVQAILSPWLGPDADQDAIQLGVTTLRTWWQHRRKGESGSAIVALGTEKMRGVVDGYTKHFFDLAHCLITKDGEQPPRTLLIKMKEAEKNKNKKSKKRAREEEAGKLRALALNAGISQGLSDVVPNIGSVVLPPNMQNLTSASTNTATATATATAAAAVPSMMPAKEATTANNSTSQAEKEEMINNLSLFQRANSLTSSSSAAAAAAAASLNNTPSQPQPQQQQQPPQINMKGQCLPGKLDLTSVVDQIQANQLAYYGGMRPNVAAPGATPIQPKPQKEANKSEEVKTFGDPNTTPVVFVSETGDMLIAMKVDGVTCAHCIKIVETVLKGCGATPNNTNAKSPIAGLLDAVADQSLEKILIKIETLADAKRIAFEAGRNLNMVGYEAKPKDLNIEGLVKSSGGMPKSGKMDLSLLLTAFEVVGSADPTQVFDWSLPCNCPCHGVVKDRCPRHSQMNNQIFEIFDKRANQISLFISNCGPRLPVVSNVSSSSAGSGECTKQPDCRCKSCSAAAAAAGGGNEASLLQRRPYSRNNSFTGRFLRSNSLTWGRPRNSMTSEGTFGRTMSGLSALSIDWENMEDFDVNVDHSAHINNQNLNAPIANKSGCCSNKAQGDTEEQQEKYGIMAGCAMMNGGVCDCGPTCVCVGCPVHDKPKSNNAAAEESSGGGMHVPPPPHLRVARRSSLRKTPIDPELAQSMQVSFKA